MEDEFRYIKFENVMSLALCAQSIEIFIWNIHSSYKDWLDLVDHISQRPFPVLLMPRIYIMVSAGAAEMQQLSLNVLLPEVDLYLSPNLQCADDMRIIL